MSLLFSLINEVNLIMCDSVQERSETEPVMFVHNVISSPREHALLRRKQNYSACCSSHRPPGPGAWTRENQLATRDTRGLSETGGESRAKDEATMCQDAIYSNDDIESSSENNSVLSPSIKLAIVVKMDFIQQNALKLKLLNTCLRRYKFISLEDNIIILELSNKLGPV